MPRRKGQLSPKTGEKLRERYSLEEIAKFNRIDPNVLRERFYYLVVDLRLPIVRVAEELNMGRHCINQWLESEGLTFYRRRFRSTIAEARRWYNRLYKDPTYKRLELKSPHPQRNKERE